MATQLFRVTGTRGDKPFDDLAKVAGGKHTEESLVEFYRAIGYKEYKNVTDLKATYVGEEDGEPIGKDGLPTPLQKGKTLPPGGASSSGGGVSQSKRP